jgi:hypothetical protein
MIKNHALSAVMLEPAEATPPAWPGSGHALGWTPPIQFTWHFILVLPTPLNCHRDPTLHLAHLARSEGALVLKKLPSSPLALRPWWEKWNWCCLLCSLFSSIWNQKAVDFCALSTTPVNPGLVPVLHSPLLQGPAPTPACASPQIPSDGEGRGRWPAPSLGTPTNTFVKIKPE